ncbi:hypothetical protein D3C73_831170 [compost metagenome]
MASHLNHWQAYIRCGVPFKKAYVAVTPPLVQRFQRGNESGDASRRQCALGSELLTLLQVQFKGLNLSPCYRIKLLELDKLPKALNSPQVASPRIICCTTGAYKHVHDFIVTIVIRTCVQQS